MDLKGVSVTTLREALWAMYPGAEVKVTGDLYDEQFRLSVQYPGMPEHECFVTRLGMAAEVAFAEHKYGCLALYINERLGKPVPKEPDPPAPPSGIRDPYSCGHCGALVSPDVDQCEHCKAWLMPAQGATKRQPRSKPPPMKLPPSPQKVLL